MTDPMPDVPLPAQSFEEAIPYLRAPYMPNQVRAKILTTPESPTAPCTIALYAITETQMDRFTLTCGSEWDHEFTKVAEEKAVKDGKTSWYCMVAATFTAFGISHADIGEGTAPTRAGAEMNARAQAGKRAGRKFGPGQCLYACEPIKMWRGDKPDQLRIPKGDGDKRYLCPYFDKEGQGQAHCRNQYARWLTDAGEAVYGPPLNHLEIALAIQARAAGLETRSSNGSTGQRRARSATSNANGSAPPAAEKMPTEQSATAKRATEATTRAANSPAAADPPPADAPVPADAPPAAKKYPPLPDHPAPPAAVAAASTVGYGEPVARLLSNLARTEGENGKLSPGQLQAVANWIATLANLKIAEDTVVKAIAHHAKKNTTQERRQAKFAKWLSEHAAGEDGSGERKPGTAATALAVPPGSQPDANKNSHPESARALAELHRAKEDHEYTDRVVTRLAALATGVGPKARVDWPKVPPSTLDVLAELLNSAGSLGWSNGQLDKEVLDYHNSTQQTSAAGRFSAFANYLTDLAETRSMTQTDAIEVG